MKLYATVASERAKKGQGGEWLDINCKDERGVTFAIIKARKEEGWFMPTLEIQSICKVTVNGKANQEKGEKQKIKYCFQCSPNGGYSIDGVCEICQGINDRADEQEKGEKQKGECSGKHESVDAIIKCDDCRNFLDSMK